MKVTRKLLVLFCTLLTAGCSSLFFSKKLSFQEYSAMVSKPVKTLDDVLQYFPKNPDQIHQYAHHARQLCDEALTSFLALAAQARTVQNTLYAFDDLQHDLTRVMNVIEILEMVSPDEAVRNAAHTASLELKSYAVATFANKKIYEAFKALDESVDHATLSDEERYALSESLLDFKRSGFELPDDEFAKLTQIKSDLAKTCAEFDKNINQDESSITVAHDALDGLSDDFIAQLKKTEQGDFILGCDYPTYFEVMEHCTVSQTRKKLFNAFNNRAYPANKDVIQQIRVQRDQMAQLLGYKNFAQLDIEKEMAGSPERAEKFLIGLAQKAQPKMAAELTMFVDNAADATVCDAQGNVYPWDLPFIKARYKKEHLAIDDREVAEYFPLEQAVQGMFDIYQKFLSLRFTMLKPSWSWHEDVQCIQVNNATDGQLRGYVFIDLHPRPSKYSHACHAGILSSYYRADGLISPSAAVVIANFPKPTPGKPALLKFSDVETFFHEFGHAMHAVLGTTQLQGCSGTSVKLDFVEMPSQMFEEWLYDPALLKALTHHYKTGQPIPDHLVDGLIALKKYDAGMFLVRQVGLSLLSLWLHTTDQDPDVISKEIAQKYLKGIYRDDTTHMWASFGHLGGYSARYYGYMWSKVYALDLFDTIKKGGLLSPENGKRFVSLVLGKGGSADPNDLLKNYLGREPQDKAFFKDLGL